jgi:hypothetical protein
MPKNLALDTNKWDAMQQQHQQMTARKKKFMPLLLLLVIGGIALTIGAVIHSVQANSEPSMPLVFGGFFFAGAVGLVLNLLLHQHDTLKQKIAIIDAITSLNRKNKPLHLAQIADMAKIKAKLVDAPGHIHHNRNGRRPQEWKSGLDQVRELMGKILDDDLYYNIMLDADRLEIIEIVPSSQEEAAPEASLESEPLSQAYSDTPESEPSQIDVDSTVPSRIGARVDVMEQYVANQLKLHKLTQVLALAVVLVLASNAAYALGLNRVPWVGLIPTGYHSDRGLQTLGGSFYAQHQPMPMRIFVTAIFILVIAQIFWRLTGIIKSRALRLQKLFTIIVERNRNGLDLNLSVIAGQLNDKRLTNGEKTMAEALVGSVKKMLGLGFFENLAVSDDGQQLVARSKVSR